MSAGLARCSDAPPMSRTEAASLHYMRVLLLLCHPSALLRTAAANSAVSVASSIVLDTGALSVVAAAVGTADAESVRARLVAVATRCGMPHTGLMPAEDPSAQTDSTQLLDRVIIAGCLQQCGAGRQALLLATLSTAAAREARGNAPGAAFLTGLGSRCAPLAAKGPAAHTIRALWQPAAGGNADETAERLRKIAGLPDRAAELNELLLAAGVIVSESAMATPDQRAASLRLVDAVVEAAEEAPCPSIGTVFRWITAGNSSAGMWLLGSLLRAWARAVARRLSVFEPTPPSPPPPGPTRRSTSTTSTHLLQEAAEFISEAYMGGALLSGFPDVPMMLFRLASLTADASTLCGAPDAHAAVVTVLQVTISAVRHSRVAPQLASRLRKSTYQHLTHLVDRHPPPRPSPQTADVAAAQAERIAQLLGDERLLLLSDDSHFVCSEPGRASTGGSDYSPETLTPRSAALSQSAARSAALSRSSVGGRPEAEGHKQLHNLLSLLRSLFREEAQRLRRWSTPASRRPDDAPRKHARSKDECAELLSTALRASPSLAVAAARRLGGSQMFAELRRVFGTRPLALAGAPVAVHFADVAHLPVAVTRSWSASCTPAQGLALASAGGHCAPLIAALQRTTLHSTAFLAPQLVALALQGSSAVDGHLQSATRRHPGVAEAVALALESEGMTDEDAPAAARRLLQLAQLHSRTKQTTTLVRSFVAALLSKRSGRSDAMVTEALRAAIAADGKVDRHLATPGRVWPPQCAGEDCSAACLLEEQRGGPMCFACDVVGNSLGMFVRLRVGLAIETPVQLPSFVPASAPMSQGSDPSSPRGLPEDTSDCLSGVSHRSPSTDSRASAGPALTASTQWCLVRAGDDMRLARLCSQICAWLHSCWVEAGLPIQFTASPVLVSRDGSVTAVTEPVLPHRDTARRLSGSGGSCRAGDPAIFAECFGSADLPRGAGARQRLAEALAGLLVAQLVLNARGSKVIVYADTGGGLHCADWGPVLDRGPSSQASDPEVPALFRDESTQKLVAGSAFLPLLTARQREVFASLAVRAVIVARDHVDELCTLISPLSTELRCIGKSTVKDLRARLCADRTEREIAAKVLALAQRASQCC
eukprot:TRINITY_DN16505_c0_g1_i2.p1 TRINITY_DN16505_c0_g1~~TRINITY_DN16505_c0_g1_i2.p1  ORF type:complete len:1109 (+),score=255.61 TRINITY_DN16505_c0_g1_i2:131-3457(+)